MRDLFTVAKFTINDMVRKKSFIISSLLILCFIIIGFDIPNIMDAVSDEDTSLAKSLVVDSTNIYEGTLSSLNEMDLGYEFVIKNEEVSFEEIKKQIEKGKIDEAIVIKRVDGELTIEYIIESTALTGTVPTDLQAVFNTLYYELQLSKLNITEEEYAKIHEQITYDIKQTREEEVKGNVLSVMLISILLFFAIYFYAFQVSSSITTEKTSKIIETLITSTKPRTIVLGKTIGIGIVGLLSLIVDLVTAFLCKELCLKPGALDGIVDLSTFTPTLIFIVVIYFILGYSLFSLMYALVGSTVSKPEDVQSANGPVNMIAVLGFYLAYFTMMDPTSNLNGLAALIPISSPFCMPFRVMMDITSIKDIFLSIMILLVSIALVAYVSIRIYSNAILNNGTKIEFKDLIKIWKNKDN